MMKLNLSCGSDGNLKVLCLGSHSDDIEIGCGGTILQLLQQYPACTFYWVVFSAIGVRKAEAQRGVESFVGCKNLAHSLFKEFPDTRMPFVGADIKTSFDELKQLVSPDLIFTHSSKDAHQDHRLISELTWNAFRDHFILEYEIPKYDGDMGQPSVFVPLEPDSCKRKIRYILDVFKSQHCKRWFEESTFLSLMRLRGMECNAPSGYAEAFYCRKLAL
jgi:LmbE family N-acetylglucosaminyl deacetylase